MEALADADLVLVVLDSSQAAAREDMELLDQVAQRPAIAVENKVDIASSQFSVNGSQLTRVRTSAVTGEGIPELRDAIQHQIGGDGAGQLESGLLTNIRHQGLVQNSLSALSAAETAVHDRVPHEMLLLDLYNALRPLDEITGATTNDDILNLIFSTFCIGK
jgi:tRNA modification GTPase